MSKIITNQISPRSGDTVSINANVSVAGTITYEDVTNVDAIGIVTAKSGIIASGIGLSVSEGGVRVTGVVTATSFSGGSVNGTTGTFSGVVTATSFSGDGSQLTGIESGVANFVASGTIPNGATVVIKDDGTVGVVTSSTSNTPNVGSEVVFNTLTTNFVSSAYDSTNGKVVIAYRDDGNSSYGTAIVGTVSGTSISFGTKVVFNAGDSRYISASYDSTNGKVVIAYRDDGNSSYGKAIVGTVSGTSISFGTEVQFTVSLPTSISSTYDPVNQKLVITYWVGTNGYGTAIVGTVSGNSIIFGSEVVFNTATTNHVSSAYDSTNEKVVIAYQDAGNSSYGTARVGTVSGNSISFGSEVVFNDANTGHTSAAYDSTNGKVVIAYSDAGNSSYGTARVGTVSGTSISFGTEVVFNTASTTYISSVYDSTNGKVVIDYRDSQYGTAIVGTVSGTSISFGSEVVFNAATTTYTSSAYDSTNGKVVIAYRDDGNSSYGTAIVFSTVQKTTNLTAENYIGIAAEAISNGATGKITVVSGTNSSQTGLTTAKKYYVQNTGGIGTVTSEPSVVAGTSISSTKILVR